MMVFLLNVVYYALSFWCVHKNTLVCKNNAFWEDSACIFWISLHGFVLHHNKIQKNLYIITSYEKKVIHDYDNLSLNSVCMTKDKIINFVHAIVKNVQFNRAQGSNLNYLRWKCNKLPLYPNICVLWQAW